VKTVLFLALMNILVHGHRGAKSVKPENTMPSFEHAIQAGADFIELDLAVTKDDVLVVSHDPVLPEALCSGGRGTRVVREMTLQQLRQWDCGAGQIPNTGAPSLEEVLALARKSRIQFNIEIKSSPEHPQYTPSPEAYAKMVIEAIREHGVERRCIVQSFDFRTLHAMRKLAPDIRLSALESRSPDDFAAIARRAGGTEMISPHYRLVTPEKVKAAHAAGLQVVPWTVNDAAEWRRLIDAGVDAIITDDPAGLVDYLKRRR
jgi:glycerophosphoryl diester phosphodiesterase